MEGKCPECDSKVILEENDSIDDEIRCDDCDTLLVITSVVDPVELEVVEEDDGGDYDEEDEY